ncbi:MAG: sulfatase-like hydrolase/transferase [Niabella sp.]
MKPLHLDKLAAEGMRFIQAYAAAPICSPARAGFITGQYPARVGIADFLGNEAPRYLDPVKYYTLNEALSDAGYHTGIIGKWHLDTKFSSPIGNPQQHGFNEVIGSETKYIADGDYFYPYDKIATFNTGSEGVNTKIAELTPGMSGFAGEPQAIHPATLRKMPGGNMKEGIGHEGCTILKIGGKYVLFGTGWSTNKLRHGSYNLYYAVADHVKGPYGPRKFAGRFLGHGTPFRDKEGRWWCTAFYNADVATLPKEGIQDKYLSDNAYTINQQGVTLVPLDIKVANNGDVVIKALDAGYAQPGPDEVQEF